MEFKEFIGFASQKVIATIIVILAITSVNFVMFRMAPGDPVRMMFKDPRIGAEEMQLVREKFGLDKSMPVQFLTYIKELSKGNLGTSFWQRRPVTEVILDRLPNTLKLVLTALCIATIIGTLLGAMAGWKSGSRFDSTVMTLSLSAYSVPAFAMGMVLMLLFAYVFPVFPLGGIHTPASGFTGFALMKDTLWHLVLPATSLTFWFTGEYVLLTRNSMIDVLDQDYITTARVKGIGEKQVLYKHALRNALLPVVTATGIHIAFAIGGVIEAETVFSWPGLGRLTYEAVLKRDYPLLQGIFLFFSLSIVVINLIVDLTYRFIDPRIKLGDKDN